MKRILLVTLVMLIGAVVIHSNRTASAAPPDGFTYSPVVSGLNLPVDVEIMPDGGILVAEKGVGSGWFGRSSVRLARDGEVQVVPVISLSTNTYVDSGILGMILDPSFASNHYFYVWYSTGAESLGWDGVSVNRLSRFTFDPLTETADPASETIVIDDIPVGSIHNGGGMAFDQNGILYISTGEGNVPERSQDMTSLNGKILRIIPTETGYSIPPDNPFIGSPDIPDEIYASGLRSPHRLVFRESNGRVYVADVGQMMWEEFNLVSAGANFGWPVREGPCPIGQALPCNPAPPQFTDPILYYMHPGPGIGSAISAIAFYEGTAYPDIYQENVFFADINQGFLARSDLMSVPVGTGQFPIFDSAAGNLVDALYHQEALFFVDIYTGQIMKLVYTGGPPQPQAVLEGAPVLGPPPLEVAFSAAGSTIISGTTPAFHWNLGDGSPGIETSVPEIDHVYPADGNYTASVQITDSNGGVSNPAEIEITVYSGEMPILQLTNLTEPGRPLYHAGDTLEYLAARSTTADLDPEEPFTWAIDMVHNQHHHPIIAGYAAISDTLELERDDHGGSVNIRYRFTLTMHTDQDVHVSRSMEIFPKIVTHTIATDPFVPEITQVSISNVVYPVPHTFPTIVGTEFEVVVPAVILFDGGAYNFDFWAPQPGSDPFLLFVSPEAETVQRANYSFAGPLFYSWLPVTTSNE